MKDMKEISWFLGSQIKVSSNKHLAVLHQQNYIDIILKKIGLSLCHPACTLVKTNRKLVCTRILKNTKQTSIFDAKTYQRAIHLACSCTTCCSRGLALHMLSA